MTVSPKIIEWVDGKIRLIDQTRLPQEQVYLEIADYRELITAIKNLSIRGAPAIGVAAAYGLALGATEIKARSREKFLEELDAVARDIAAARPTAVNLFWALERMKQAARKADDAASMKTALLDEARRIEIENAEGDRNLAKYGASLIEDGFTILTHCNTGPLATAGYGTALGVIRAAREQGKNIQVYATETRPLLQGARLTCWELMCYEIPVTLITDSMAGYVMNREKIDCVIVGADRIAANGDTANKIGTYTLAVLATENGIPFYVAAPTSTVDLSIRSGAEIPIEERKPEEVTHFCGMRVAAEGVKVANPAFDVTPHIYISAIITEKGIIREPFEERLRKVVER